MRETLTKVAGATVRLTLHLAAWLAVNWVIWMVYGAVAPKYFPSPWSVVPFNDFLCFSILLNSLGYAIFTNHKS
jgi:hypothetical protein